MAKQRFVTEKDLALKAVIDAREELRQAEQRFSLAVEDFFEIANSELTIAQMRYDVANKKLLKIIQLDGQNPQRPLFFSISEY
jgi:hypothetical protein